MLTFEQIAKLKDLDLTCRWLFPLIFFFIVVLFAAIFPAYDPHNSCHSAGADGVDLGLAQEASAANESGLVPIADLIAVAVVLGLALALALLAIALLVKREKSGRPKTPSSLTKAPSFQVA